MFLELQYQNAIENLLTSEPFEWHYNPTTVHGLTSIDNKEYDTAQFTHVFWYNDALQTSQQNFDIIKPLLDKLDIKRLYKIKANLLTPHPNPKQYHLPHWDTDELGYTTLLYYVNDSDGDTILFDKLANDKELSKLSIIHKETPVKGNALKFNSDRFHASNNPIHYQSRIVLNIVYKE